MAPLHAEAQQKPALDDVANAIDTADVQFFQIKTSYGVMLLVLQPYQPTMLKFEIVFYVFLENLLNVLGTKYQSGTTF